MKHTSSRRWLEVAVNGPWTRQHQPLIPVSEKEIIEESVACVKEGAAIVHIHPYDPISGRQKDDPDIYTRIIEGIRSQVDAIVCPTVPFATHSDGPGAAPTSDRFAAIDALGARGLLEWSVVDLGSLNFITESELKAGKNGFVHTNSVAEIRHNLDLAERHRFHPSFTIYEPGFMRFGSAMRKAKPGIPTPVYRLMFSDDYTFGFRPHQASLDAYLHLIQQLDPDAPWMIAGLGVDVYPLMTYALHKGGHIRVGLEDLPAHTEKNNLALVKSAVNLMRTEGYEPASAAEVRESLKRAGP